MSAEIRIPVPAAGSVRSLDLVAWFRVHVDALSAALDLIVAEFDKKAQIDSIQIDAVDMHGDAVTVTYQLSFSASYTCSGIDYAGTHQRTVTGVRDGDFWVFRPPFILPKRSTADEL
ncbi:MAG TPA: hypothetical protein PLY87_19905 [Planctomycetaceae bacterium]|nr:hypothetical protein [Planctomycetaceae bacterium]HQZ67369.1 hypothetical protein [Planctomycetaceae bacterium]